MIHSLQNSGTIPRQFQNSGTIPGAARRLIAEIDHRGGISNKANEGDLFTLRFGWELALACPDGTITYEFCAGVGRTSVDFRLQTGGRTWLFECMTINPSAAARVLEQKKEIAPGISISALHFSENAQKRGERPEAELHRVYQAVWQHVWDEAEQSHIKFPVRCEDAANILAVSMAGFWGWGLAAPRTASRSLTAQGGCCARRRIFQVCSMGTILSQVRSPSGRKWISSSLWMTYTESMTIRRSVGVLTRCGTLQATPGSRPSIRCYFPLSAETRCDLANSSAAIPLVLDGHAEPPEVRCHRVLMEFPAEPTGLSTDSVKLAARASAVVPGRGWSWLWPCLLRRRRDRCDAECRRRAETPFWASVRWPAGWASVVVRTGIRLQPVVQSP